MEDLYLIVGLGNPGSEYAQTRHNMGFLVLDRLGESWGARWQNERRFQSRLAQVNPEGRRILLCQPLTFMNCSGEAVQALTAYYRIPHTRLLIVVDDADLPLGSIRLRPGGGSSGHHGLESVEQHLGTKDYLRLRLGIGRVSEEDRQIRNYVLGRFSASETEMVAKVIERSVSQIVCWLSYGLQKAMSLYNGNLNDFKNPGTKDS